MRSSVSIVTYHYVRPIKESAYPSIKGLELEGFRNQLDYLSERFEFVTAEDVVQYVRHGTLLPENACWLTFDDGYSDHHKYVFPELKKRGIQGSFFAPVDPVERQVMLDVNSIHFILASSNDLNALVHNLNNACRERGISEAQLAALYEDYAHPSRYDDAQTIYVKRLLQHALPEAIRHDITTELFRQFVGVAPESFAAQLYMSVDDIKEMISSGMYFGSHGAKHYWLNKEDEASQETDILRSLSFLEGIGAPTKDWIMCFPYGAYDDTTLDLLRRHNCAVGITVKSDLATLDAADPLTLPRYDTNDFPQ